MSSAARNLLREALEALHPDDRARAIRDELVKRDRARRNAAPFAQYVHDPMGFARRELGMVLWSRQEELLKSIDEHEITVCSSGQKTGKSAAVGGVAALWWVITRPRGKVLMTSGNADQVKAILWDELTRACNRSQILERIGGHLNTDPRNGLYLPDGRFIIGVTARDAERIAGHSGDEALFIVDESSGFDDALWKAIRGNLLGGAHAVATGNPTRTSGWFFDYFTTKKGEANCLRISSRETPNYIEGRKVIPGLAERHAVDKLIREYGEGSAEVQIRVDGMHATSGTNAVVGMGALERAVSTWSHSLWASATGALALGVDVARFGDDDSVIQPVRGLVAGPSVVRHGFDTVEVTNAVLQVVRTERRWMGNAQERPVVVVDVSGLGAGVYDQLCRYAGEVDARAADSAANANEADKHHRLRDELWWNVRTWLAEGGSLPPDDLRDQELLAPTYSFDGQGRTVVESKDDIKRRLKRSPDRADALCLAISRPKQRVRSFHVRGL